MRGKLRRYFGPIIGCEFSHGAAVTIANNVFNNRAVDAGAFGDSNNFCSGAAFQNFNKVIIIKDG